MKNYDTNIDYRDYRTLREYVKAITDAEERKKQTNEQEAITALKRKYTHLFRMMDNDSQIRYRLRHECDEADYRLNVVRQKFLGYSPCAGEGKPDFENLYASFFVEIYSCEGYPAVSMYPVADDRPKQLDRELDNLDFLIQGLYSDELNDIYG